MIDLVITSLLSRHLLGWSSNQHNYTRRLGLGGRCCEFLCTKHVIFIHSKFLSTSLKAIFGIFLLVIRIRFRQKTLNRTVLSFFSSSTRAPFQKTPHFSSPIGLLMFQNLFSLRILEWMAIYKPLTIYLQAHSLSFPLRVQRPTSFEKVT